MSYRLSRLILPVVLLFGGCDDASPERELEPEADGAQLADDASADANVDAGADARPELTDGQVPGCVSEVHFDWQPGGSDWGAFPDDYYTVADPDRLTGLRVDLSPDTAPWLSRAGGGYLGTFMQMNSLDGWGTSAPIFLTFDAPLAEPIDTDAFQVVEVVGRTKGTTLPAEIVLLEDQRTVLVWPYAPLRASTPHTVFIKSSLLAADGSCVAANPVMRSVLSGSADAPALMRLVEPIADALKAMAVEPSSLAGALHFTTQTVHDSSNQIAADIAERQYRWTRPLYCTGEAARRCEGDFSAFDYRQDGVIESGEPVQEYTIPVSIWLPEGEGPWPVWILGHGLGGDRSQGDWAMQVAGEQQIVIVAIDAVSHGEHPGGASDNQVQQLLDFFAIDLANRGIDALQLRDTFRQSTFDRLQLYQLILAQPDITGDETPEFDLERIGYFGISLGAIMGPQFLAFADRIGLAFLGMPGARLTRIVRDHPAFSVLGDALFPLGSSAVERERYLGAVQTVIEEGDPVNYAGHIVQTRLPGHTSDRRPDLLMMMAIDDETVSNSSTAALLRAIPAPLVAPPEREIAQLPAPVEAPVEANMGGRSVAMVQLSTVSRGGGVAPATHNSVLGSDESVRAFKAFHEAWVSEGRGLIIDPR